MKYKVYMRSSGAIFKGPFTLLDSPCKQNTYVKKTKLLQVP